MTIKEAHPDCFSCLIKNCTILNNCSEFSLKKINDHKNFVKFRAGQVIIHEGMPLHDLFFIYHGKVKITSTGLYGKQQIKRLSKTGDFVGFRGISNEKSMPVSITAIEDTEICTVEKNYFLEILKSDPELMSFTLMFILDEFTKVEQRMKSLTTMNVREKTAEALLFIYEAFGNTKNGLLEVKLSRQEMAEIAMTTKEQISKCLSEFIEEGKIKIQDKNIYLIKIPELRRLIGE